MKADEWTTKFSFVAQSFILSTLSFILSLVV